MPRKLEVPLTGDEANGHSRITAISYANVFEGVYL